MYGDNLNMSLIIVTLTLQIEYYIHASFAKKKNWIHKVSFMDRPFVSPWTGVFFILLATAFIESLFFTTLALPIYKSVFILGYIISVGFSNDGGTIVSVNNGFRQNVVAYDAVSGWIISSFYLFIYM